MCLWDSILPYKPKVTSDWPESSWASPLLRYHVCVTMSVGSWLCYNETKVFNFYFLFCFEMWSHYTARLALSPYPPSSALWVWDYWFTRILLWRIKFSHLDCWKHTLFLHCPFHLTFNFCVFQSWVPYLYHWTPLSPWSNFSHVPMNLQFMTSSLMIIWHTCIISIASWIHLVSLVNVHF